MSGHTPGPWRVRLHNNSSVNGAAIVAANGLRVVSIPRAADRSYEQKEADARLIAAAPDLLMALWFALSDDNGFACPSRTELVLRAAIATAEGREP